MFTASHNPAKYNGMKLCKSGAKPIGQESGLIKIRQLIEEGVPISNRPVGTVRKQDLLTEYVDYLLARFPEKTFTKRKLKVVIDAGNGMAGFTAPAVMEKLKIDLVPMYFELDGNFPNHEANPIEPENLKALQKRVKKEKADIGLAFDGDADRCFLVDENGDLVNPSALTALIAVRELKANPGATIIYNLISSKAVPEVISENGGTALRRADKVGLKAGDVIVEFDGSEVDNSDELIVMIRSKSVGDKVKIKYKRNSLTKEVTVTLVASKE
jgi:phosphomannomutase